MLDDNVRPPWRARTTLVFTLTLLAIGLGNLQRMPYLMGEVGGGTFFLAYVVALCVLSVPVLIAEVVIGSLGRGSPGLAMHWAASAANVDSRWQYFGVAQAILALLIAAMAGLMTVWCVDWAITIYSGNLAAASAVDIANHFVTDLSDTPGQFVDGLAVVALAGAVSLLGGRFGIGALAWLVLPVVSIGLLGVLDFVFVYTDLQPVGEFLFTLDLTTWHPEVMMPAVASAGLTLGAGLGVGMAMGTHAPYGLPWVRSVLAVGLLDTAFMLVMAIIFIATLFATNTAAAEGLTAILVSLPYALVNLPLGETYGALFFAILAVISGSALVLLMEPAVLLLGDEWQLGRVSAVILVATGLAVLLALLLFGSGMAVVAMAHAITEILIPLSLLMTAFFAGWVMPRPVLRGELYREPLWLFRLWWALVRWVVPPLCLFWLLMG